MKWFKILNVLRTLVYEQKNGSIQHEIIYVSARSHHMRFALNKVYFYFAPFYFCLRMCNLLQNVAHNIYIFFLAEGAFTLIITNFRIYCHCN